MLKDLFGFRYKILFVFWQFAACNPKQTDATSTQSFVVIGSQWQTREVPVCWVDQGYEKKKLVIKDNVTDNFNAKTNLKFIGFDICDESKGNFKGIRIGIVDTLDYKGKSEIGSSALKIDDSFGWEKKPKPTLILA